MTKKYTCFIISPIGEKGSETRRDADDLLSIIVEPALNEYGFNVIRGDHRAEANRIDVDVIKSVQEADLCICNLSEPNINVYYELGRRDETGKPVILLKPKNSGELPIDIATRRYIEYDLDDRYGIRDARDQLSNFVKPLAESGFEGSNKAATLSELADILSRIERKIDRSTTIRPIVGDDHNGGTGGTISGNENDDPRDLLKLAMVQGNVPMAENAMEALKYRMDTVRFLDQVVEQVASLGSHKAGELLIKCAQEFMDNTSISFVQKVEYMQSIVQYASKRDKENEVLELIESISMQLLHEAPEDDLENIVIIHNQRNKVYYGIFLLTGNDQWLQKSINEIETALRISPATFLHYNAAICYNKLGDLEKAVSHIDACIALRPDTTNADHLEFACELYFKTGNPKFGDMFAALENVSHVKAALLRNKLKF